MTGKSSRWKIIYSSSYRVLIKTWRKHDKKSCWFNELTLPPHPSSSDIADFFSQFLERYLKRENEKFLIKEISLAAKISFFNFFQSLHSSCDWMEIIEWGNMGLDGWRRWKLLLQKNVNKVKRDWRIFFPRFMHIELLQRVQIRLWKFFNFLIIRCCDIISQEREREVYLLDEFSQLYLLFIHNVNAIKVHELEFERERRNHINDR